MGLEILILIGILLAKAQEQRGGSILAPTPGPAPGPLPRPVTSAPSPGGGRVTTLPEILITASPPQAAAEAAAAAQKASQEARDAASRGDTVTASQKSQEAAQAQATAQRAVKAAVAPPAWPQVVPAGLPPFPSSGWRTAAPVTAAMSARAWQLLPQLWQHGEGTWKTEKTGPQWVTYRATGMGAGKRGVVVYTTTAQASAQAATAPPVAQAAMPVTQSQVVPASAPAPASAPPSSGMPTLRLTSPRQTGPSVVWLQQRLGLTADGTYGSGSAAAVQHFQSAHGLTADGVVGPATWAALGVGQRAAA